MDEHVEVSRLLELNHLGLIPGPNEDEETFLARVDACQNLKATIHEELKDEIPFTEKDLGVMGDLAVALGSAQRLYGVTPEWIPIFYSNRQLAPWHGGCAWIFQMQRQSPRLALLQLRRHFAQNRRYLGLYDRDELVTHELAHVGRMAFEEPKFEELLAYQSSHTAWRRWLGPVLQSSQEAVILLGLVFLSCLVQLFTIGHTTVNWFYTLCYWAPLVYLGGLFTRLWWRQRQLKRAKEKLVNALGDNQNADHLLYRLTDSEVLDFGGWKTDEIVRYAQEQSSKSLRWHLLHAAYFASE